MSAPRQILAIAITAWLLGVALGAAYFAGRLMQDRPPAADFACGGVL